MSKAVFLFPIIILCSQLHSQNIFDTHRSVKMYAEVVADTALQINWIHDPEGFRYELYRKTLDDQSWGEPLMVSDGSETSYLDQLVPINQIIEYRVIKFVDTLVGYGYLYSGIEYPISPSISPVLLVIEEKTMANISDVIRGFVDALEADGFYTESIVVKNSASAIAVKESILETAKSMSKIHSIILLGDVPVPHSGNINPDAHTDHKGAWPADLYYGDLDGMWTDTLVSNTSSENDRNHNVPGDGRFDQSYIPSDIEIAVGRIDFSELDVFEKNEYELLEDYILKNIKYRKGEYQPRRKAIVKNTNPWNGGLGQNGIRNFSALVSLDSIVYQEWNDAFTNSYLWYYGGASGSYTSGTGLGNSSTYAEKDFLVTFTGFFGSYFGDYDYPNNFLRSILASGDVLATNYTGAPNWHFHPMAMGFPLGYITRLSQNNSSIYEAGYFPRSIHSNLLGDPTLKSFVSVPPRNLEYSQDGGIISINWEPPFNEDVLGYFIYRKGDYEKKYTLINDHPISSNSFMDSCVYLDDLNVSYLIRSVDLVTSPSGTFRNLSSGAHIFIDTVQPYNVKADFSYTLNDNILHLINSSQNADQITWTLPDGSTSTQDEIFIPYDSSMEFEVTLEASNLCHANTKTEKIVLSSSDEIDRKDTAFLYPNPVQKGGTITTIEYFKEYQLESSSGNLVDQKVFETPNNQIILNNQISAGTYILTIVTKKGAQKYTLIIL
ncbi:T9SS type A sorting domain-containing protein [Portibacter marinus]|uniref:T9SS type A sorting domain-containing protein n=1 Tax=Portibacter marinus TaxID=2898660 RepID=UPI001F3B2CE2|nr:T9SS type A sorting domain-containing protein [Portibacter marinus]